MIPSKGIISTHKTWVKPLLWKWDCPISSSNQVPPIQALAKLLQPTSRLGSTNQCGRRFHSMRKIHSRTRIATYILIWNVKLCLKSYGHTWQLKLFDFNSVKLPKTDQSELKTRKYQTMNCYWENSGLWILFFKYREEIDEHSSTQNTSLCTRSIKPSWVRWSPMTTYIQ